MPSDNQANGVYVPVADPDGFEDSVRFSVDRVLLTAGDRPSDSTLPAVVDPTVDHVDVKVATRRADVDEKHQRVIRFLDQHELDGVLFGRADSIAWFTSGGELGQTFASDPGAVLLLVTRSTRAILADNVQSARAFEEELAGLGFQLKERPWYNDPTRMVAELTHNKAYATDTPWPELRHEPARLLALRGGLSPRERQNLRDLGRTLTLALEATCRNFQPGETEADVAGHLAHRLIREGVVPVDLRVASDDRLSRFRQPHFKAAPIMKRATITATGRRHGLCASATRTVSFGPVDQQFRDQHAVAVMVDATCIYFSRPGEQVAEVFRRARRIYEKFDHPHEWELDYQGYRIGYGAREAILLPESPERFGADGAVCWCPSVASARSSDTIVVDRRGFEVVTEAQTWPKFDVAVKGFQIARPGILER